MPDRRRPICRPVTVEVDGELVHARVRGVGQPTEADLAIVAAAARKLREDMAADPTLGERQAAAIERIAARRRAAEGQPVPRQPAWPHEPSAHDPEHDPGLLECQCGYVKPGWRP